MPVRQNPHNIAIVAHADRSKTALVNTVLWQSGAFSEHGAMEKTGKCVMNSDNLEREKGITILAKDTATHYSGPAAKALGLEGKATIDVVDTPGHTDFGGKVEHGLSMVDSAIFMVDASEGPLPQARFVLRKALQAQLPIVVVVNKVDRLDLRIEEVVFGATDLLLSLGEDLMNDGVEAGVNSLLDAPVIYASAKAGAYPLENPGNDILPTGNFEPLLETILNRISGPSHEEDTPLQAHVTSLDASPSLGRLALLRIHNGTLTRGASLGLTRHDGTIANVHVTGLLRTGDLERISTEPAGPGKIVAVASVESITIGESLVDLEDPRPLPLITIDDPAVSMTIDINTSLLASRVRGAKVTARQVKDRLDHELVGSVSLRVFPTERPDAWEVQGRGELALAILVEQVHHEGFELTVGKPQVIAKEVEGVRYEPMERMTIDIPEEYLGVIIQLMTARKRHMGATSDHGSGWIRLESVTPARDLVGFRTRFLTETRGAGIASSIAEGYAPWQGAIKQRLTSLLVASRADQATPYAMTNLQECGSFIVEPFSRIYKDQVIGENPHGEDVDVNICREKKQVNTHSATADVYESLTPSRELILEESLGFAASNEYVEVTPDVVRVYKVVLDA